MKIAAASVLLALLSCASTDMEPQPAAAVIVFGALWMDLLDQPGTVEDLVMARSAPGEKPVRVQPERVGDMFYTDPLPLGGVLRITSFTCGQDHVIVPRDLPLSCALEKPGLLFLGGLEISGVDSERIEVRKHPIPTERQMLQDLLDAWRGTGWEGPIRDRIRLLEDHFSQ